MKQRNRLISVVAVNLWLVHFVSFSTNAFAQETVGNSIKWGFEYDLMAPRLGAWHSINLSAVHLVLKLN